jgi:hypothetical protein
LTLFKYLSFLRTLLLWKQVLTVLFFYLYYLYCLSIFQRTCCFRFKSGCKGKGFIFNYQTFSEVFFYFFFLLISQALYAKGKECIKEKTKAVFFANRTAKIRTLFIILQNFLEVFFVLFFKRNLAFSLCQFCKAFFSWKAGAKVRPFGIQSKYIKLFFRSFFERIC